MTPNQTALLQGTLDLLILNALTTASLHGLGVARRIEAVTMGAFRVKPGSLFPALHCLDEEGWLSARWSESENNRRAKNYQLTRVGRGHLEKETAHWGRISLAISPALEARS